MDFFTINILCCCLFGSFGLFGHRTRNQKKSSHMVRWYDLIHVLKIIAVAQLSFFYIVFRAPIRIFMWKNYTSIVISKKTPQKRFHTHIACVLSSSSPQLLPSPPPSTLPPHNSDFLRSIVCLCHLIITSWFMPVKYQNFLLSSYRIEYDTETTFYGKILLLNEEKIINFSKFYSLRPNCTRASCTKNFGIIPFSNLKSTISIIVPKIYTYDVLKVNISNIQLKMRIYEAILDSAMNE